MMRHPTSSVHVLSASVAFAPREGVIAAAPVGGFAAARVGFAAVRVALRSMHSASDAGVGGRQPCLAGASTALGRVVLQPAAQLAVLAPARCQGPPTTAGG